MKASDIREQTTEELESRLDEIKKNIFNLKFQKAIGQLENTQTIRNLRKDVALIETIIREKEMGINTGIKAKAKPKRISRPRAAARKASSKKNEKASDKGKKK